MSRNQTRTTTTTVKSKDKKKSKEPVIWVKAAFSETKCEKCHSAVEKGKLLFSDTVYNEQYSMLLSKSYFCPECCAKEFDAERMAKAVSPFSTTCQDSVMSERDRIAESVAKLQKKLGKKGKSDGEAGEGTKSTNRKSRAPRKKQRNTVGGFSSLQIVMSLNSELSQILGPCLGVA